MDDQRANRESECVVGTIIIGETKCSICGRVLDDLDDTAGSGPFIADPADLPFQFCNTGFHFSCYKKWEHRAEFEAKFAAADLPKRKPQKN